VALIGGMGYIADHMPPTKIARELSEVWWRRMLRITVRQRLYPQCKSCFSRQGEAVRSGTHTLVYHLGLRPCHFASAAALVLLSSSSGRDVNMHCARLEDTIIGAYRSVYKFFTWNEPVATKFGYRMMKCALRFAFFDFVSKWQRRNVDQLSKWN
jgi:hypothetical protein